MSTTYGFEHDEDFPDLHESDELYETDEASESEESQRRRPPRFGRLPTAGRGSAYRPRPSTTHVTQAQLQAALARVSQQISTNSNAIRTLDGRVRSVATEQGRATTALRKETIERKKEIEGVRKDLQATRQMTALLPLLTPPPRTQTVAGVEGVMVDTGGSNFAAFAPLLLLGTDVTGGTSGSSSGSGMFGGGATGLIALLALTGSLGGRR